MSKVLERKEFVHFRLFGHHKGNEPEPRGGVTVCYLPNQEGARIGVSVCSLKDNFNRKIGNRIAEGRAAKSAVSAGLVGTHAELIATIEGRVAAKWVEVAQRRGYSTYPANLRAHSRNKKK